MNKLIPMKIGDSTLLVETEEPTNKLIPMKIGDSTLLVETDESVTTKIDNTKKYFLVSEDDFEHFAQQMIVTFPLMPDHIKKEWSDRINRSRSLYIRGSL